MENVLRQLITVHILTTCSCTVTKCGLLVSEPTALVGGVRDLRQVVCTVLLSALFGGRQ